MLRNLYIFKFGPLTLPFQVERPYAETEFDMANLKGALDLRRNSDMQLEKSYAVWLMLKAY
jgi:hypothetical protein